MKLSVFFDHVLQAQEQTGKTLEELLVGVRAAGIEAVEINLSYLTGNPEILDLLKQNELNISCIYEFYDMGHCDETEKSRKHIETAVQVGAARILVVPGFLSGEDSERMQEVMPHGEWVTEFFERNSEIQNMKSGLSYIATLGKEKGITVTVEDFDDRNSPLSGMYGIWWFLQQVPELRYTLDTGNFLFYGEDVFDAWELLSERIAHVHCKDRCGANQASVQTGSGYIPFGKILYRLQKKQYDGYLAIEHFDVEGQEVCMKQSAEFLRGLL